MIHLNINGKALLFDGDEDTPLLWYLRDGIGLTGTKFGCGMGLCGACTVHINGKPVRSCLTPVKNAASKNIVTIEGLSRKGDHPLQIAWKTLNVPQCGYCQAGQLMTAAFLIKLKPNATDQEIVETMSGNICRCGTYHRIRKAVRRALDIQRGGA